MTPKKKLIEVALPLVAINVASAREKSIRHGHPSTLHLWWARRPLAAARAVHRLAEQAHPAFPVTGTNALASSIVLVCRQRPTNAPTATRREFVATLCERKKRAVEAMAYNGLVQSWPEITRLAREVPVPVLPGNDDLFDEGDAS